MKYIVSLIFSIILFTGCTNINLNPPLGMEKDKKQELISKANSGDIQAMVELNKIYLFPQTKVGLDLYTKWTEIVLQSKNIEDILAFAKVYEKDQNMFINGKQNYMKLLQRASNMGSKDALYLIQELYVKAGKNYKFKEFRENEEKIVKDGSQDDLIRLYEIYNKRYKTKAADRIRELMNERRYTPNLNTQYSILKTLLKQKNKEQKIQTIYENMIASQDVELIENSADLFYQRRMFDKSLGLFQRALELEEKADTYYIIAEIYKRKRMINYTWRSKKHEKEINENLERAALLDHFEATKELLKTYHYDKEYKEKYKELTQKVLKLHESKRALAYVYISYDRGNREKAYDILDELASKNNEKAIIELATKANTRSSKKLATFAKKWQEFILNSNNPSLMQKAKKNIHIYKYARFQNLREFRDNLEQIELQEQNIYTFRELYKKYQGKDEIRANKYMQKAIDAGDVYTANTLIKQYRVEGSKESINKAIELYEMLSQKADITATKRLADIYYFGLNSQKYMLDIKKALYYMEKAYDPKDTYTLKKLAKLYMLNDQVADLQKAKPYINELVKQGYVNEVFNLTWKLDKKKTTPQKEILKLYEIAGDGGHTEAYYAMAWIYYHINKDYANTINYLEKAAQKYNTNSIIMLGNLYLNGEGVAKDITKAIEYYELAGDNTHALYNLAYAYSTINDYKKAIYFYKRSAKKNNKAAYLSLGMIYQNGSGVEKNIKEAIKYYKKSDTPEAKEQIKLLEENQND